MSSYIINAKNTSGDEGTISADVGFNYSDKLNSMNEANIKISGSSETKRGLIEVGSEFKIYRDGTLEFYGVADLIDFLEGGGLSVHCTGYEVWLAKENGDYANSPWSATASATIFSAIIAESNYLTGGTVETGTNIDFRLQEADSLWNALSNLKEKTQQDIGIDYPNSEVDILDHKGSSTSVETFNAGIQIANLAVTQSYPQGNDVRVYGKSEGETRIKSDHASYGQDATSKASYGTIRKIHRDPSIVTQGEANILADALVAIYKDPIKVYDFEVLNPSKDLVSGDVLTLNAKSQGLNNEEVRIVSLERGIKGGGEYLTLQVTNKEYSRAIKNRNEIMAGIEKNNRDQQTYDAFQDEYSNQNINTTLGGFCTTDLGGATLNSVRQVANSGALTLGTTSGYIIYLIPSNGDLSADVQVWGHLDMYTNKIKNLANPTANQDGATKYYVDNAAGGDNLGNHTATQNLNMNYYGITNCRGGLASGTGYNLDLQAGIDVRLWSDINMNSYDIDNCEDLEVNDIYDYNQGYIYCADDFELQYVERIRANTANLRLEGGTDPVVIGWNTIGGSNDDLFVSDDLDVFGSKNCLVEAKDGHKYIFSVIESPEVWFEEKMSSKLVGGRKEIILDERFIASTVIDKKHPLHAIVTPTCECNGLWVEKKFDRVIIHASTLEATFDITISAKRLNYEEYRFDEYVKDKELDIEYKKSKEVMFLEQKPLRLETEQKKEIQDKIIKNIKNLKKGDPKLKIRKQELKKVNKDIHNLKNQTNKIKDKYKK